MPWLLAILSGAMSSVGVLFPALWPVSAAGLILFIHLLEQIDARRVARLLLIGWAFGSAYCAGVHVWLWHILPLDWLGIDNQVYGILLILFYWSTIAIFFGVVISLFSFLYIRYRPHRILQTALFGAALWTLIQYIQVWGTSLVTAGSGSLFGAHYSTVMMGYALSDVPSVLYLSRFGSIYAMTFVFVFVMLLAYLCARAWQHSRNVPREAYFLLILVAMLSLGSFLPRDSSSERNVPVALVTTDFGLRSSYSPSDMVEKIRALMDESIATSRTATLYILPEEMTFLDNSEYDPLLHSIDETGSGVLFSGTASENGGKRVRMWLYADKEITGSYDKMLLSPQGEYGPWFYLMWLHLFGSADLIEKSLKNYTYERGDATKIMTYADVKIGGLFCSDILSPQLYRFLARDGAEMLVESTSLAWFNSSPIHNSMMLAMARVRAAENGKYLVISGNATYSAIISDTGRIIARTELRDFTVLRGEIPLIEERTIYTLFGTYTLVPYLILVLMYMWRSRKELSAQ